ncbi:DNA glycosylase [Neisseria meningitidis]|nr:DNA glycosylase [Neisseria meningitidis]MBJ7760197.1 DNA glycosylase [Neisseria meningitidis]MBJ7762288.1 DNA glycosylase [Neisseria meningitidis]MBJ7766448.1 DNA glycosylase [Neisseria meningitidis]MBJ7774883.1 DNA glycosylase [Neisseria meningitidis]
MSAVLPVGGLNVSENLLEIETHPFDPVLPSKAAVMMMGTFPPKEDKRAMQFHYPNFQNDMWRVYGLVFFGDADYFKVPSNGEAAHSEKAFDAEKIKTFLHERGIASCPTVLKAVRQHGNASDKFLKVVETVDLAAVLVKIPDCRHICTTGGKATEILLDIQGGGIKMPKTGETVPFPFAGRDLTLTRLPSTSRAYPLSLAKKAAAYRAFFEMAGLCEKQL